MASTSTHTSPTPKWSYEVFLSFRGEDTRKIFVDHLFAALSLKGIHTFTDDEELRRGEEISPALLKAIEESNIALIVFSKRYASSKWCLDELVKIIECKKKMGQTVIPIFYNVDPSQVRNQTGSFAAAFRKHEKAFSEDMEKVQRWRAALEEAANLSGVSVRDTANGHESKCIQKIIEKMNHLTPIVADDLEGQVGMDSRLSELESLLHMELDDVRSIGLWGMGGIGKTTIARALFKRISNKFEGTCFLADVREKSSQSEGLETLQARLLSETLNRRYIDTSGGRGVDMLKHWLRYRRVLVIVDDVDHLNQLEALVGKHDWFGYGSRIIVTTRNIRLLNEVNEIYKVKALECDEAIQLFSSKAFNQSSPYEDYVELSEDIVCYTGGLPLALKVLGSYLCGRTRGEWKSTLNRLHKIPEDDIFGKLIISFNGLNPIEKEIFLDIACFFKGEHECYVKRILDSCGFEPEIGIRILIEKCLISVSEEHVLCMHDLIREMGWRIVDQESPDEAGERSRLWRFEDLRSVLAENTGTEKVKGVVLKLFPPKHIDCSMEAFTKLTKLRLLVLHNVLFPQGPPHLSNELRWLDWPEYPSSSLPASFRAYKLVELRMRGSLIEQLWEGIKFLDKLTFMDFRDSQKLQRTPDLTGTPKLESLYLDNCTNLVEVHPSLGRAKSLRLLNLKGCKNLKRFPSSIHLESLEKFDLSGCLKLENFPEISGDMAYLRRLDLDETAIKELPSSIERLTGLIVMTLRECKYFKSLPTTICRLRRLTYLTLSGCSNFEKFPEIFEDMGCLLSLYLDRTAIRELPSAIEHLIGVTFMNLRECEELTSLPRTIWRLSLLEGLALYGCSKLEELPDVPENLKRFKKLQLDETAIKQLPSSINLLEGLEVLSVYGCKGTTHQMSLISSISSWLLSRKCEDSMGLVLPSLTGLGSLSKLDISDCNLSEGTINQIDFGSLRSLKKLNLSRNNFFSIPVSISQLSKLEKLQVVRCKNLEALPELPSNTAELYADDCPSLRSLADLFTSFRSLWKVRFTNCFGLLENQPNENVSDMFIRFLLKELCNIKTPLNVVLPVREIPEWFSHQISASTASLELPPGWYNKRFMGIAVCAACDWATANSPVDINFQFLRWNHRRPTIEGYRYCRIPKDTSVKSGHIWFSFVPAVCFTYGKYFKDVCQFEVFFSYCDPEIGSSDEEILPAKKWGVHLVYLLEDGNLEIFDGSNGSALVGKSSLKYPMGVARAGRRNLIEKVKKKKM